MTQDKIYVEMSQLEAKGTDVLKKASEYESSYETLYSQVEKLGETWKGTDFEAFRDQLNSFKTDFAKMRSLMESYGNYLKTTSDSYTALQNKIANEARTIEIK